MTARRLHLVVPGSLEQRTGGYLYDARMVSGLRDLGWSVEVHNLAGSFPDGDARARSSLSGVLTSLHDGVRVVIDGLAMGGLPGPVRAHGDRLRIVSLVHHPLAEETGLSEAEAERFRESERRALASCRGVIVSSPFTAQVLADYGVPADRVRVALPAPSAPRRRRDPVPTDLRSSCAWRA